MQRVILHPEKMIMTNQSEDEKYYNDGLLCKLFKYRNSVFRNFLFKNLHFSIYYNKKNRVSARNLSFYFFI